MTQTDFRNQVDNLMNILFGAGVASHATIIEQINYLVFLRSLSRKDDNAMILDPSAEKIFSGELRKYHWDNLLILNADELFNSLEEVFRKLPEITTNQTIKLLFRDAHVKVFAKPTLRRLVHEIEKMFSDLEKQATAGHTDIFGDMYEYLLSKLSQAGTLGSFRTPRHIIKFIVDVIDPKKSETILDPACGTAGFLVAALKHLEEEYSSDEFKKLDKYPMDLLTPQERDFVYKYTFTGFDSDFDMFKFGLMNLYLHKLEHPNMKRQNTLVDTAGDRTKWDVILANPPFAGALDIDSISEDLRMGTRSTEILFLRYIIDHLSSSGRAGVIVPEGVVFNSTNAHKKIRQMLVEDAGLWCVVSLPGGIFNPYAGVKTSILFFDKSLKDKVKDILFVKIENDGFDLGATKKPINKNDLPIALTAINIYKKAIEKGKMADFDLLLDSNAVATSIENIKKLGYDLTADDHVTLVKAINKVLQSEIKNNGYNLNGEQYGNKVDESNKKWLLLPLSEVFIEIKNGKNVKQIDEKGKYRVSRIQTIANWNVDLNKTKWTNDNVDEKDFLTEGDILLSHINSIEHLGKNALFSGINEKVVHGINLLRLKPNQNLVLPKFISYVLHSKEFISKVLPFAQRAVNQASVNITNLKNITIPIPPLEIQKQLVEELDGYQEIIDGAKQIVENWKPDFKINLKWKKVKIKDVCFVNPKKIELKDIDKSEEISFVPMADLGQNEMFFTPKTTKPISEVIKGYTYFANNDVLIAKVTPCFENGKAGIAKNLENGIGFGSSEYHVLRPNKSILPEIVYVFLTSKEFKNEGKNKMTGTGGLQRVPINFVENWEISLPPIEEQKEIIEQIEKEKAIIDPLKKLIELYQEKINQKIEEVWGE